MYGHGHGKGGLGGGGVLHPSHGAAKQQVYHAALQTKHMCKSFNMLSASTRSISGGPEYSVL